MSDTRGTVIELTEEQKKQMRDATGAEHQAIRVEVGTRIAPAEMGKALAKKAPKKAPKRAPKRAPKKAPKKSAKKEAF